MDVGPHHHHVPHGRLPLRGCDLVVGEGDRDRIADCLARRPLRRYVRPMDLTYPPEAEALRKEVRAWLEDNLPQGWFEPGFRLSGPEREAFNADWVRKLRQGGWICASWPKEYGGKGLSLIEQVVLNEEFARVLGPHARRLLRRHVGGTDHLAVGNRGTKTRVHPQDPRRHHLLAPGFLRTRRGQRPGLAQDTCRPRR